jgi:Flp pilus assembly protein protease CpaA
LLDHLYKAEYRRRVFLFFLCFLIVVVVLSVTDVHHPSISSRLVVRNIVARQLRLFAFSLAA